MRHQSTFAIGVSGEVCLVQRAPSVCIAVELVTGFFSLTAGGTPDNAASIVVHRIAGYGILFILVWKLRLVFSSLKFPRSGAPRYASIFLLFMLLATLARASPGR